MSIPIPPGPTGQRLTQRNAARPGAGGWFWPALAGVLLLTVFRVALLAFNRTDLWVDEAQYWYWGQSLQWGYYSKPPLIAVLIRGVTGLAGSDAAFWVRLPAPLLHGATAMVLGAIAARQGRGAAIVVAMGYVSLPMVALGSALITTDTLMLPLFALALLVLLAASEADGARARFGLAGLCGVLVGLAFLAKYTAVFFLIGLVVAGFADPRLRPGWRSAAIGLSCFALVIAPNVLWNLQNGLVTAGHTLDNLAWPRGEAGLPGMHFASLFNFVANQFIVFGPIPFAVLLTITLTRKDTVDQPLRRVAWSFCWPVLLLVSLQALLDQAYANWAVAAYLGGSLLVFPQLLRMRPVWLVASFVVNGSLCVALPLVTSVADRLRLGSDNLLLKRYVGQAEMSRAILALAAREGLPTVVAADRGLLADLFYTGRELPVRVYSVPFHGVPPNHYAMTRALPGAMAGEVLFATLTDTPPPCAKAAQPVARIAPVLGTYQDRPVTVYRLPATCWGGGE